MPNVSIAVYVSPGRCPGLWATFGLTARPNSFTHLLKFVSIFDKTERNTKVKNDKTERKNLSVFDKTERNERFR